LLPKLGAEFKKRGKEAIELLILRTRFQDKADRKVLIKRRDDWIKDLNMNLIKGKVVKSTHYFDDLCKLDKIKMVRALEVDHESRDLKEFDLIAPFVRSMSIFKPYAEFETRDFEQIFRDIKLHKVRKGTRIANFGDNADTVYLILHGRVAITFPNFELMNILKEGGPK